MGVRSEDNKVKKIFLTMLVLITAASLTGCYLWKSVQANQVGVRLDDGVSIKEVVPSGRYSNAGWFASLEVIDVSAKTSTWNDPDLVTKDKQPIGLSIAITYARKRDADSVKQMWTLYRGEATSDEALANQVLSRIPAAAKTITTEFTLDDMLGVSEAGSTGITVNRQVVTSRLFELVKPELEEVSTDLLDIRITNIQPDAQYLALLSEKAQIQLKADIAKQQTAQLVEQLKQEQQKTLVDMEIASRANKVNEEMSKAYQKSPELFRLKMIEALKEVFGGKDKVFFIPEGSPLSIISGMDGVVPVNTTVVPSPAPTTAP